MGLRAWRERRGILNQSNATEFGLIRETSSPENSAAFHHSAPLTISPSYVLRAHEQALTFAL